MSHKSRNTKSYIVEYSMKIIMVLYLASAFYLQHTLSNLSSENNFTGISIIKLGLFAGIAVILLLIGKEAFKVGGFSLMVLTALAKVLILISQDNFHWYSSIQLSDSILIIGISLYCLYRHSRKVKASEYKRKKTSSR